MPFVTSSEEIDAAAKATAEAEPEAQGTSGGSLRFPEKSPTDLLVALTIFAVSCLHFRFFYNYTLLNADEGIALQGAQRILNGEVLYRDFFSLFTPGSYYWMALFLKVFGNSILVGRAVLIVYGGVFSVLAYLLARRVCPRWSALLTAYLVTVVCLPYRFIVLHNWDSTLWAYLTLYYSVRFLEEPHWGRSLAAGILGCFTCLFEQSKGAGLLLGLLAGFGAVVLLGRRDKTRFSRAHLWAFLAGFALPLLITVVYFATQHSLSTMVADCLWPFQHYQSVNKLPYGDVGLTDSDLQKFFAEPWAFRLFILVVLSPCFLIPALPIVAVGVLGFGLVRLWQRKESQNTHYYVVTSATMVGLLLSTLATGRADLTHIMYQAPLLLLVLAWGLDGSCLRSRLLSSIQPMVILYVFVSFTALGISLLSGPLKAHSVLRTRRGVLKAHGKDLVVEQLQACVRSGHSVFIYPYQPLYYYLAGTSNPTRYEFLMPGMNTPEQFEEVLRRLDEKRTPVVLFQPSFGDNIPLAWPGTPPGVLAARDIGAQYIFSRYRPCKSFTSLHAWQFVFMVRKDLSCAGPF
jgi:hypothetical protein